MSQIRTTIPVRGRKLDAVGVPAPVDSDEDKNHNPRKGTETLIRMPKKRPRPKR